MEMQPNYKKLLLQSNKEVKMSGDLEVLMMLKMHYKVDLGLFQEICDEDFKDSKSVFLEKMDPEYIKFISGGVTLQ